MFWSEVTERKLGLDKAHWVEALPWLILVVTLAHLRGGSFSCYPPPIRLTCGCVWGGISASWWRTVQTITGSTILRQPGLHYRGKVADCRPRSKPVSSVPPGFLPQPLLELLPELLSVTDCDPGVVFWNNCFPPQGAFGHFSITTAETNPEEAFRWHRRWEKQRPEPLL